MYTLYIHVYMKMFESMYVTKIKVKGKSTKVLYACMVHGKGLGLSLEGREE